MSEGVLAAHLGQGAHKVDIEQVVEALTHGGVDIIAVCGRRGRAFFSFCFLESWIKELIKELFSLDEEMRCSQGHSRFERKPGCFAVRTIVLTLCQLVWACTDSELYEQPKVISRNFEPVSACCFERVIHDRAARPQQKAWSQLN